MQAASRDGGHDSSLSLDMYVTGRKRCHQQLLAQVDEGPGQQQSEQRQQMFRDIGQADRSLHLSEERWFDDPGGP